MELVRELEGNSCEAPCPVNCYFLRAPSHPAFPVISLWYILPGLSLCIYIHIYVYKEI